MSISNVRPGGHPDVKPGILEVGILLKTRFALDRYINLRPVKLYPNVETPLFSRERSDQPGSRPKAHNLSQMW